MHPRFPPYRPSRIASPVSKLRDFRADPSLTLYAPPLQLAGEYGLRNKREIWRIQLTLSKVSPVHQTFVRPASVGLTNPPSCPRPRPRQIRRAARELLKLDEKDPKRLFEGNALIRRLVRIGVLDDSRMRLDYVLALKVEDFLERRLQTQVFKSG